MTLEERMKKYEMCNKYHYTLRVPVIVRVDGKGFSKYTKNFKKPFSDEITQSMISSTRTLFKEMQGCKLAYTHSDEASFLLTDWDSLEFQPWVDYNINKVLSLSASIFTAQFNRVINGFSMDYGMYPTAKFDARGFNIPKEDIANYFLWRCNNCVNNSITNYARYFFSHKELMSKSKNEILQMLFNANDIDSWESLKDVNKNGTIIYKKQKMIEENCHLSNYNDWQNLINNVIE